MANYRAIANGNWSNLAIWQDDSLGYFANSTVLPTTADDVYANNFTVTIDGTRNAFTIRNTAFTPPTNLGAMSIPQMTSNTTPSGAAAASSVNGGQAAWQAFDRNTGTVWQSISVNAAWLSYNFPTGRIIKRYGFFSFSNNANNPRTWTFEGSNNGSTWVVLDTQTNFVTGTSTFFSFDISANTTSYTFYRINITAVQTLGQQPVIVELEMSEVTNLYGGIVAGGGFTFANGGNLTCSAPTNSVFNRAVGSVYCLTFDLPSGQSATFNGSVNSVPNLINGRSILVQNTGTFNMVGDYGIAGGSTNNTGRYTIVIGGATIVNLIGNITNSHSVTNNNTASTLIFGTTANNSILNMTGNVSGSNGNTLLANYNGIYVDSNATINLTGNITTNTTPSIFFNTTGTLNLIGNVTGGTAFPAVFNQNTPCTIDILGTTTSGSGYPAIQGLLTTFVKVRGNVIHTDTYAAIYAGRVVIDDNVTSWQFKDSTNTVTRTLYTPGVALGNPATSNVRNGVTYGPALELTGTLVVANPSNVLLGVPTDNTTGTYSTTPALIANEIFTKLLSSTDFNTSGSFGKLVKDNLDAQVSSRLATSGYTTPPTVTQIRTEMDTNSTKLDVAVSTRLASASYVAPDNADIAAIKAVTDTLTDVATETTSLAIKTRTDLIPNNPASVDAVGAIVASYNV